MRQPSAVGLAFALGTVAACHLDPDTAAPRCRPACHSGGDLLLVEVPVMGLGEVVEVELNPCLATGRLPDGAPVVVALLGGFTTGVTPVDRDDRVTLADAGIVTLYPSFPQTGVDFDSGTLADYRGTSARIATATVLDFAAGRIADQDGCMLADRLRVPLSSQPPLLHGQSNGGNLALATLADPSLDLPPLAGLTFFETPAGPQFVTVEFGPPEAPLPAYEPGSCAWDALGGLVCALDYGTLAWDPTAMDEEGRSGAVWFDLDGDGICTAGTESWIWGLRPVIADVQRAVYSPPLTAALELQGPTPEPILVGTDLPAFWVTRDGSRAVAAAMERFPDLGIIVLGTEVDHALGLPDHAHVSGLAGALVQAGARWSRLNPDAAYVARALDADPGWEDNAANTPFTPGDPAARLLPDENGAVEVRRAYLSAAFLELQDRRWHDVWDADLETTLPP